MKVSLMQEKLEDMTWQCFMPALALFIGNSNYINKHTTCNYLFVA